MKAGDIILVHSGKSFISRSIAFFMRKYQQQVGVTAKYDYHHCGTIIDVWGKLHIAEANVKGYQIQTLDEAYTVEQYEENIEVKTPLVPYTQDEQDAISRLAVHYSMDITRYQVSNFLLWIIKMKTNLWIGRKGKKAEQRLYCSEAVATLANYVRPGTFDHPEMINPIDVDINPNYKY
jgi:hypothetical protein